jgi:UrcA family protein
MIGKLTSTILSGSLATAAAALSLSFSAPAGAQPYYDRPYDQPNYSDQDATTLGDVVVTPSYRPNRTVNGIPTERVYASRVVDVSDLDLSTGYGVHVLRHRVERAAADACNELDNRYPSGLVPIDSNDGDCKARAVRHAMADAPIGQAADTDYTGY